MKSESRRLKFDAPVLLATNTFGLLNGEVNGVARTCQQLASCFRDAGVPLEVLTYGSDEGVQTDGCVTIRAHKPRPGLAIDPALRIDPLIGISRTAAELGRREYSLVHSTTPDPLGILAADIAARRKLPFVAGYHTAIDDYVRLRVADAVGPVAGQVASTLMRIYLRGYYRRADLVLAPSCATADELRGWLPMPVRVLGRGVDSRQFSPGRRRVRSSSIARALYVGRVAVEKGLETLVPMFRRRESVALTVVGDGPWLRRMRQLLPEARYTGTLIGDALADEYASSDFFVFPSQTDTFGNVVLEAMSSGLPVIVTDRGGPAEIVRHGVDGLVTSTAEELESAILRLASSPALCERLGRSARAAAERRSWPAIFVSLLDIYQEAARLRSAVPSAARHRPRVTIGQAAAGSW